MAGNRLWRLPIVISDDDFDDWKRTDAAKLWLWQEWPDVQRDLLDVRVALAPKKFPKTVRPDVLPTLTFTRKWADY